MTLVGGSVIVFPKLDPAKDASQKGKRNHVCSVCSRAFKRSEHCIRHQRGHTQEKPFGCRVCRRRYSRRDLLVRHERTLHTPEQLASAIEEEGEQPTKKRKSQALPSPVSTSSPSRNSLHELEDDPSLSLGKSCAVGPKTKEASTPSKFSTMSNSLTVNSSTTNSGSHQPQMKRRSASQSLSDQSSSVGTMPNIATPPTQEPTMMGLNIADFSVSMPDLDKMRTFPTSVPLPDLDGDLEFLDFFDPFLGMEPKQMGNFAIPPVSMGLESWSPLEHFSCSSQTSMQDYGFLQAPEHTSTETVMVDADEAALAPVPEHESIHEQRPSFETAFEEINLSMIPTEPGEQSAPKLARTPFTKPPALLFTEQMRSNLLKDLSTRLPHEQMSNFRLPSAPALQKCIRTAVDAFHVHVPIFHLQTMDFASAPSPLLLAICAIGALYRLERKIAAALYLKAEQALSASSRRGRDLQNKPRFLEDWSRPPQQELKTHPETLWQSQARLLIKMFATFSGDPEVISNAIAHLGDFLIDFRQLAPGVKAGKAGVEDLSWQEWINRESIKRLLYGHVLYGNLVTMTFGIPPGYSIVSDGYIEMPCDQSLWDAPNAEQWQALAAVKGKSSPLSLRDAVSRIMYGNTPKAVPEECWSWSPFAVNVVINAVSIQLWHIAQGSYFLGELSGVPVGKPQEAHKSQILTQAEAALSRCRALITQARTDADYAWTEAEGPLLFNCLALLRVSYCRAFTGTGGADSTILLKESHEELMASIEDFVAMPQERSELITRAVSRAFEGMLIPYKMGTSLLKKTAALTWAVEHALAGWDAALLVTKWVHVLEIETAQTGAVISELEEHTMRTISNLMAEVEDGMDFSSSGDNNQGNVSVAAKLTRYWAGFYDDTWVWGVTPRMGWVLRELACCYESNSPVS
ncbi:hypothetical protein LTR67_005116 [Exophiala xenobiotica]